MRLPMNSAREPVGVSGSGSSSARESSFPWSPCSSPAPPSSSWPSASTCFGCGNQRSDNDGLRIFPGPVAGQDMVAATWRPDPSLAGADGGIGPEIIWAAIDCPGSFAVMPGMRAGFPAGSRVMLGRSVAEVADRVEPARPCVIMGWPLGAEGRKLYAGVALFSNQGTLLAATRQTWIVVLPPA